MADSIFNNKTIALGISGGIAAYKAVDLASKLAQRGALVMPIMTGNAIKFVSPLTFQSVTGQPVLTDLFAADSRGEISHIAISEEADLVVVAPATANIMAKAAHGLADDALSTTLLAACSQVVMIPAMNNHMWNNMTTRHNIEILKSRGVKIMQPDVGRLACGEGNAVGRFPDTGAIIAYLEGILSISQDLAGKTIMVTAGGTREPIDPVRFIGNHSSGKMGFAIAEAARARGAEVILITGPTCLNPPQGAEIIHIETARQMYDAVTNALEKVDGVVMTAAVADFRPSSSSVEKIKKERMPQSIGLELNPDILQAVSKNKGKRLVVGFAAESENVIENAKKKIKKKGLDLIVANDIASPGVGFGSDLNLAVLINKKGPLGDLATYKKTELAEKILDWMADAFLKAGV